MTRPGWNPTRRNRNLGTAKAGHGLDNRLVIPASRNDPRRYWERLRDPVSVAVGAFTILVESWKPSSQHAAYTG